MRLGQVRQQSASLSPCLYRAPRARLDNPGIEDCTLLSALISSGSGSLFSTGRKTESTKLPIFCRDAPNLWAKLGRLGFYGKSDIVGLGEAIRREALTGGEV